MPRTSRYWFPRKRYGWGWGLPLRWQGWVTLLVYFAAIAFVVVEYPPATGKVRFVALVTLSTLVLIGICWLTGEPPRWSWGEHDDA